MSAYLPKAVLTLIQTGYIGPFQGLTYKLSLTKQLYILFTLFTRS